MNDQRTTSPESGVIVHLGEGAIRVQLVASTTLRVEVAREDGSFCDEPTFTIRDRSSHGELQLRACGPREREMVEGRTVVARAGRYSVELPLSGTAESAVADCVVRGPNAIAYRASDDVAQTATPPEPDAIPLPRELTDAWVLHDRPRVVPPAWGSTTPEPSSGPASGWRVEPEALDTYVVLAAGDHGVLRRELVSLTGAPPLPPRWTFGFWHSRYYPYTSESVLGTIDEYDRREIPIDAFVIDTDWREGASRGYTINRELFPNMEELLQICARRGIHVVFNDHPEPRGFPPLDPELFAYRERNLTRLLDLGLDGWWFDRNWGDIISGPVEGLETAVWGQKLYHDIQARHDPARRVCMLSMYAQHPASHRYPLHWTGDIHSDWPALRQGIEDTVLGGYQLCGYVGQDIGGHCGYPSPEQYVRWMQWGSVSPTMRVHAGPRNRFREPWRFGASASAVAVDYVRLRYRLLPLLYSLGHELHRSGTPIVRGMDLAYPEAPEWARVTQFMLGEDLVVAPVTGPIRTDPGSGRPHRFSSPLRRRVWYTATVSGRTTPFRAVPESRADETAFEREIRFDALRTSELRKRWSDGFVAVWDGEFEVASDGWYRFDLRGNGRKSLTVDDAEFPQMLALFDGGGQEATLRLDAGRHRLLCTYEHGVGSIAHLRLAIDPLSIPGSHERTRQPVWVPPGRWRDLWTGAIHEGPARIDCDVTLAELPALVRAGGIIPVAAVTPRTRALERLVCDIFVDGNDTDRSVMVYDDDGTSTAYLAGRFDRHAIRVSRRGTSVTVRVETGGKEPRLASRLRVHLPEGQVVTAVSAADRSAPIAWRRLPVVPDRVRTTPIALDDEVRHYPDSETVVVDLDAGERGIELTTGPGSD